MRNNSRVVPHFPSKDQSLGCPGKYFAALLALWKNSYFERNIISNPFKSSLRFITKIVMASQMMSINKIMERQRRDNITQKKIRQLWWCILLFTCIGIVVECVLHFRLAELYTTLEIPVGGRRVAVFSDTLKLVFLVSLHRARLIDAVLPLQCYRVWLICKNANLDFNILFWCINPQIKPLSRDSITIWCNFFNFQFQRHK